MPLHDPEGLVLPHLRSIDADLKDLFQSAHLGVTPITGSRQSEMVAGLQEDPFYDLVATLDGAMVGEQFRDLYEHVARTSAPEQLLHLAFPDRVAYALLGLHRDAFMADVRSLRPEEAPHLFQRSMAAWASHPRNYREIEGMLASVGELLFGQRLDFAWCHLAVPAGRLRKALALVTRKDMSMLSEIILALMGRIATSRVDWLSWEDPLITGEDPEALRASREMDPQETRKRLAYVLPMLDVLARWRVQDPQTTSEESA